ncbi:SDR family oxidoreductase [Neobacillus cucumis]|uniref:SDR family oxidoreductase n=1 Tax=Neobacillus cucumis TaxID=1740721 RepID=UPI0018DEFD91|nr:SDR family oxidoreductase [Neobacillus cucumis]MBI0578983.1 SDR family oxidoreductase [Neobacillus cucumis]
MSKLKGQIAIVTGVSHELGIGAAICRKLAAGGADLFFTHWRAARDWTNRFQEEMRGLGVTCKHKEIDLAKSNAASEMMDSVLDELGCPTILVNNAAHSERDGYMSLTAKCLDEHYAVNMRSTFLLCCEFARHFELNGKSVGRIINITSGQGLGPMPGELAYAATKGAISAFTITLSAELAPKGITVNAVNPGPTDTGWMTEDIKAVLAGKFLMGRIGHPEDAAQIVAFLASKEAEWITGQVIHSEGGFLRN